MACIIGGGMDGWMDGCSRGRDTRERVLLFIVHRRVVGGGKAPNKLLQRTKITLSIKRVNR